MFIERILCENSIFIYISKMFIQPVRINCLFESSNEKEYFFLFKLSLYSVIKDGFYILCVEDYFC